MRDDSRVSARRAPVRPGLLFFRLRKRVEVTRLVLRGQWKFWLGLVALVVGIVGLVVSDPGEPVGFTSSAVGTALGVVLLVPDLRAQLQNQADIVKLGDAETYTAPLPVRLDGGGRLVSPPTRPTSRAAVWDDVDRALPGAAIAFRRGQAPPLPRAVAEVRADIIGERQRGADVFDGVVIGQGTDLTPELVAAGGPVTLFAGRYFDLMCTNYMTNWSFGPAIGATTLGCSLSQDQETGELLPLTGSRLTNAVGASTLAVTSDRRVVLVRQSNRSASSPALWAPSGSGSVDDRDVRDRRAGGGLLDVVVDAMERELQEEAHVDAAEIISTTVIGYFRWINQGGKPEYVGLTMLSVGSEEIADRQVRVTERPFVKKIVPGVRIGFSELAASPDTLAGVPAEYRGAASLPLYVSLRAVGRWLAQDEPSRRRLGIAAGS